jgi:hypothetical protein
MYGGLWVRRTRLNRAVASGRRYLRRVDVVITNGRQKELIEGCGLGG